MIGRRTVTLLFSLCLVRVALAKCGSIAADRLVASDFAAQLPAFAKLPPETPIAPAPVPGARRVYRVYELDALAKRYSIQTAIPGEICFEWELQPLDRAQILDAMRSALPFPDLRIEIVETSLFRVPQGKIEFRREGLGLPASDESTAPVTWRGSIVYGANHRFSVWARVIVSAGVPRVVAAANLPRGEPIRADQLREEVKVQFPSAGSLAANVDEVVGRIPHRDIPAGTVIRPSQLGTPPDIARGEIVEVEVHAGVARLALTAKAESAGRAGDLVVIRNLSSNKLFQARVSGKGKAVIDTVRTPVN